MSLGSLELVSLAVVAALVVWWFGRRRWNPTAWAQKAGIELTEQNEGLVRSYLVRSRSLRRVGAILGFAAPHAYLAVQQRPLPAPFDWDLIDALIGYLLGAVVAEFTIARPQAEVPTASLQPRSLRDYLRPGLTSVLRAAAGAALALVLLSQVFPSRENFAGELPGALVAVAAILVVVLAVELLQRRIVGRPRPIVDGDVVDADDAIRSASVHALAGAGIALEMVIVSVYLSVIAFYSEVEVLRRAGPSIAGICLLVAFGLWGYVTRPHKRPQSRARAAAG